MIGNGAITPLFLVLLVVESTDILFAIDSIPTIFAILGLRWLDIALAAVIEKFRYVKISLMFVLAYVGVKMISTHYLEIPTWISLTVICLALMIGIFASIHKNRRVAAVQPAASVENPRPSKEQT